MKQVLVVCTGNTCRSVMAAAFLQHGAEAAGLDIQVRSAGVRAIEGQGASPHTKAVLNEYGLDVSAHQSQLVCEPLLQQSDLVLTMSNWHKEEIEAYHVPALQGRVFLFQAYGGGQAVEVQDPYGGELGRYRETAAQIEATAKRVVARWQRGGETMRIAIGGDHASLGLKTNISEMLVAKGYEVDDLGTHSEESVDYPDPAKQVAAAVAAGKYQRGILICGTGLGVSITANKVSGIRAALCHDVYSATMARQHNDANVLCLGARVVGPGLAGLIVETWIEQEFLGGRHQRRVDKIRQLEE